MNIINKISIFAVSTVMLISCSNSSSHKQEKKENVADTKHEVINDSASLYMLVGTYTSGSSEGIYVYKLDTLSGEATSISHIKIDNPSYLTLSDDEQFVYAVTEDETAETSAANALQFDKSTGTLSFINKQLTGGGAPCYISVDKDRNYVVTANYLGGSLTSFRVKEDGGLDSIPQQIRFTGKSIDKSRQKQPHIHCVQYSPDYKFLFVDDLGTDKIHKFIVNSDSVNYLNLGTPAAFDIKAGSGPRHLVFHTSEKYAYLITEMSGDVVVFDYIDGILSEKQTIKADTLGAQGSGDIHLTPDGRFLYASNRLKGDGIAIFEVKADGCLEKIGYQETGIHPRNFAITPNGCLLLVANRDSNNIQVFSIDNKTGLLQDMKKDISIDKPVCIKFASL